MEPLHKFYLIHKISTEKQANIYFCEINTLISCIVTANKHGKMNTKYEKVHVFLSLLKRKRILSQSK